MPENPYARWLKIDFDLCRPVLGRDGLNAILEQVIIRVHEAMALGPKPSTYLDLEQLQVADYSAFEGVSEEQRQFIAELHTREPIRPEEMIFLALRSLFQCGWPKPTSNEDIRFAATYDHVLNQVLTDAALDLAKQFTAADALLPYWGRLAFLRVMVEIPIDNISRFGLDRVACTLVKKAKLNATTFALENGSVIGMNYALEPILKHLNRYLIHYFSTDEMAGPNRLSRAWEGIAPTVLYFWSDVAVTKLTRSSTILFDEHMAIMAHHLTTDQVAFVVMHGLGHVALDHPRRLRAESKTGCDATTLRQEFEFAAALPEPSDRSTVSRRLDSYRLPDSYRSETWTWEDRVSHVPSHVPCVAGRDRSTSGSAARTHATCACFHHDGPVRQCLGLGQAQSQSPNRATPLAKVCHSADLHSINKGNCVAVPLIGQFWTVVTSAQLPVTL
jgi:hypothetical protein